MVHPFATKSRNRTFNWQILGQNGRCPPDRKLHGEVEQLGRLHTYQGMDANVRGCQYPRILCTSDYLSEALLAELLLRLGGERVARAQNWDLEPLVELVRRAWICAQGTAHDQRLEWITYLSSPCRHAPSTPGLTKLSKLKYSVRSFWMGVPDKITRRAVLRLLSAWNVWLCEFFRRWP